MAWDSQVIRFTDLEVRHDRTVIDRLFFNSRFKNVSDSLNKVSAKIGELDIIEQDFVALALARLDTSLSPLMATLQQAAELGFLVGQSTGISVSLTAAAAADFHITSAGKELFTPPKYLLAIDDGDETNWGIVSVVLYTPSTGDLATTCVYAAKTQASTSWTISANAGVLPAMMTMVESADADAATATAAVATIADDMVTIQALMDALENMEGPVATVNGMSGPAVVVGIANIANLQSTLDAKATTTALTTGLSGKQDLSAKLTTIAGMTWQANTLLMANSPTTLIGMTFTPFAQNLFDDVDAAAAQATLGISTFVRTILNNADASAVLSTLGVSTFAKTILDDTDAAAARTTLGVGNASTAAAGLIEQATDAEIRAATAGNFAVTAGAISTASAGVALADAAPVAVNWTAGVNFTLTVTANRQIGNPTNGIPGTFRTILVQGSSATARTITFGNQFLGAVPTITDCTSTKWYLLTIYCVSTTHFVASSIQAK